MKIHNPEPDILEDPLELDPDELDDLDQFELNDFDLIGYDPEAPDPDLLMTINGAPLAFRNSIFSITGMAKSRKTTFVVAVMLAFLRGEYEGIKTYSKAGKKHLVYVDTEQRRNKVKYIRHIIKKLSGPNGDPDLFKVYSIKKGENKRDLFLRVTDKHQEKSSLIILDSVSDITKDDNDQVAIKELFDDLQIRAERGGFCLGLIL